MNPRALIGAIVQQTTVFVAQISTAAGVRAPLAGVADQVFLSLAREIEAQGVGRKVVADMFGLAIRTYQKKVQRLTESQTAEGRTLWEAVLEFVRQNGPVSRTRLLQRFARDPEREVTAVLNDLVTTGLAYASGRGDASVYRATSAADRSAIDDASDSEALAVRLWAHVFDHPGTTRAELVAVGRDTDSGTHAIDQLVAQGRLEAESGSPADDATRLVATKLVIPVGEERGWEIALMRHFRAVTTALSMKVRDGNERSDLADRVGGATYTFGVNEGHPFADEVYGLLRGMRKSVEALFQKVSEYNDAHPEQDGRRDRVTFYFGQSVQARGDDDTGEDNSS